MKIILLATIICLITITYSQTPPTFPPQYQLAFTEKASIGPLSGTTRGAIYFDAPNNRQVVTRENGQYDRYCGSVYKFVNTPCNHYITGNSRFLDFPQKKYCCFCCDSAHGCGITRQDWLVVANATFVGYQKLDPTQDPYLKWDIKGLQDNLYYHKNDTLKTPRRLYQVSDDLMDFNSYYVGIKDPNVFKLPAYCTDKCGLTTICAGLRGQTQIRSQ